MSDADANTSATSMLTVASESGGGLRSGRRRASSQSPAFELGFRVWDQALGFAFG
jgi:hypothetical protein